MFIYDFQDMVTMLTGYLKTTGIRNTSDVIRNFFHSSTYLEAVPSPTSNLYVILLFYLLSYLLILSRMH